MIRRALARIRDFDYLSKVHWFVIRTLIMDLQAAEVILQWIGKWIHRQMAPVVCSIMLC